MIVMIALGIGVFLGFNIEWKSIEVDTDEFFESTNYADFRMYSDSGFSAEDVRSVQEIDGISEATRYFSVNLGIRGTKQTLTLNVSENYRVSTMFVTQGAEYDESSDGLWISDRFAAENGIAVGDELTLTYRGQELTCEVVGLAKSGENMICVAGGEQLMPDYSAHGFAYVTPKTLETALGTAFYPQINLISDMEQAELETAVRDALGKTFQIVGKELHTAYAGAQSEAEEGKTMGLLLPVLFLAIAVLTMVTTMHRIAVNEKVQIGTLKALGFRDRRILRHYTAYGLVIGAVGSALGVALGYGIAALIMSENGMMATYFDLPEWNLVMPWFCVPTIVLSVAFLTFISYASTRQMLRGTAADALRPYTPKRMKRSAVERLGVWERLPFSVKWNVRDLLRHKARSAMSLLGVFGCMLLLVGGLGMKDTLSDFLTMLDEDVSNYATKITLSETASNADAAALCDELDGDWQATSGVSCGGETVSLDIYHVAHDKVRFLSEDNDLLRLENDGVYLCLRLKDTADIGETITLSPYGSEAQYEVRVAGYFRSLFSESIAMTDVYADAIGLEYHIGTVYTDVPPEDVGSSGLISVRQDKAAIMESYDTMLELMDLMVLLLNAAAVVLGIVVLYHLGVMSYVERRRELATLKVLGFRDRTIERLLISQNLWLTALGITLGLPGGACVLQILLTALASEYELSLRLGPLTYTVSIALTLGVSLLVSRMVARKNRKIDMVEALKGAE